MIGQFEEHYQEWLYFANCQLTQADTVPDHNRLFRYENLCYNAGLAVELAIKAYFVALKIDFEKTHDLAFLLDELS
jgi:HEPN domain-containing protein